MIFRVEARGDELQFHWQKDGIDIDSNESRLCCNRTRDTSTLHIQHTKKGDKGRYRCMVKNRFGVGEKPSQEADLLVCKLDIFTSQWLNYSHCSTVFTRNKIFIFSALQLIMHLKISILLKVFTRSTANSDFRLCLLHSLKHLVASLLN